MSAEGKSPKSGLGKRKPFDDSAVHHHIEALSRVSAAISGLRDLDTILRIGLENSIDIINGDVGGIMLIDNETKKLSYRVGYNLSERHLKEVKFSLGEGIAGKVALTGKSKLVEDISLEPNLKYQEILSIERIRALIIVPLQSKGNVLGVMNVASYQSRRFSERDMFILHSIADQLGISIEQTKLYEQLRRGRERYKQLVQQILVAQEEERRRLSRELHDETSQSLSGLALNLQALIEMKRLINIDNPEFENRLKKAHTLSVQIGAEVSRLIADLRPTILDTLGLIPAIRHYAESNLNPAGINFILNVEGDISNLTHECEAGLFRFAQGAIGNILHHSQANKVEILLKQLNDEMELNINDDGVGFDVSKITHIEEGGRGVGLFSMKERVRLMGGNCSITSEQGKGTKIRVLIPLLKEGFHGED